MRANAPLCFGVIWIVGGALGVAQMLAEPDGFVVKGMVYFFAGVTAVGAIVAWRSLPRRRMQQSAEE